MAFSKKWISAALSTMLGRATQPLSTFCLFSTCEILVFHDTCANSKCFFHSMCGDLCWDFSADGSLCEFYFDLFKAFGWLKITQFLHIFFIVNRQLLSKIYWLLKNAFAKLCLFVIIPRMYIGLFTYVPQ